MKQFDYIVVGAGLTGAMVASQLHAAGRSVTIFERRNHPAGLCYDTKHSSGLIYHKYGPHAFRTNSSELWDWLNSFESFYPFKLCIKTLIDGNFYVWPPREKDIKFLCKGSTKPYFTGDPKNFEEASLKKMPKIIYEKFVKTYSEKQWGIKAENLWIELSGRFKTKKENEDDYLFDSKFQGLPLQGFTKLVEAIIKDVPIKYGVDFNLNMIDKLCKKKTIYTGCIDELFSYKYGKLGYRGMQHETKYFDNNNKAQDCPVYNFPDKSPKYIRSIDWNWWQKEISSEHRGKLITYGYPKIPSSSEENAYPILTNLNRQKFFKYKVLQRKFPKLILCGRLADYRYYDMNHAMARGLEISKSILGSDYTGPIVNE